VVRPFVVKESCPPHGSQETERKRGEEPENKIYSSKAYSPTTQ
jgi:hypothetical protein